VAFEPSRLIQVRGSLARGASCTRRHASAPPGSGCSRSTKMGVRSAGRSTPPPGASTPAPSPVAASLPSSGRRSRQSRTTSPSAPRADDPDCVAPDPRLPSAERPTCLTSRAGRDSSPWRIERRARFSSSAQVHLPAYQPPLSSPLLSRGGGFSSETPSASATDEREPCASTRSGDAPHLPSSTSSTVALRCCSSSKRGRRALAGFQQAPGRRGLLLCEKAALSWRAPSSVSKIVHLESLGIDPQHPRCRSVGAAGNCPSPPVDWALAEPPGLRAEERHSKPLRLRGA
jgi:hypothetical protein